MNGAITLLAILFSVAFGLNPLPDVFVIGDSISMQYGPYLEEYLTGSAKYERKMDNAGVDPALGVPEVNGGDSHMVLEYLRAKILDPSFKPDFLLLNCGLHDIKRNGETNEPQVSPDDYRENLTAILDLLKPKSIRVVWIRTTPVVDAIHNTKSKAFRRHEADLSLYNQIADQVMQSRDIPMIDLHAFTAKLGEEQFIDHVHYNESTRKLQAAFIAGYLADLIAKI
jgi:lysophospholipase L1-like esterase